MSRTAATYNMTVTRGATWEDEFTYTADDKVTPINLTGYEARMQVRTQDGQYGTTTSTTLVLELTTANGKLIWDTAATGRLRIVAPPASVALLNASNEEFEVYPYSIELFLPTTPEYVLPLLAGFVFVHGEVTR